MSNTINTVEPHATCRQDLEQEIQRDEIYTIDLPQPGSWRGLNFWGYWLFAIGALLILPACQMGTSVIKGAEALLLLGTILLRLPVHRLPGFYFALAFTAWQILSVTVNGQFPKGMDGTTYNWLCLYAMVYAWQVPWIRKSLFYWIIGALVISATVSILQYTIGYVHANKPFHIGVGGRTGYSSGIHSVSLTHGFIMGCYALCLLNKDIWKWQTRALLRYLPYVAIIVAAIAVVLSSSRAATLAFPIAVFAMFIFSGSRKRALLVTLAVMAVALASIAITENIRPGSMVRVASGEDGRWPIWEACAHMIADNPVFGGGGNKGYREIFNNYPGSERADNIAHAHNIYLSIAAQYGLPALVIFCALLLSVSRAAWRMRLKAPRQAYAIIGTGVFLCVGGMFEDYIGHSAPSICCFVVIGLMWGQGIAVGKGALDPDLRTDSASGDAPVSRT